MNKYLLISLALIITIAGALPRAIEVINRNYLFGFDQGLFYEAVKQIVVEKHLTLIGAEVGGIGGFFQGPGWYYLLSIPYILWGGDPYGAVVLMFLIGIATIILPIVLFRKSFGEKTALLTGFFVALSPGIVPQSRFFWPPFVIPMLTVLYLYLLYKAYTGKKLFLPFVFFVIGLMTHFEIATGGSLLLATIVTILIIRPKHVFSPRVVLLSVGLFLITQLPLILFDIRHQFISSQGLIKFITHGSPTHNTYSIANHLNMYKDSLLSVSHNWYIGVIIILIVSLGVFKILKNKKIEKAKKQFILFLIVCPAVLFIAFLPLKTILWSWWFLELPIFLCMLVAVTCSYLLNVSKIKFLIYAFFVVYIYLFISQTYAWYRIDLPDYGGTAKIKGKIDALDYIYKDAGDNKFGLFVFTPPVYTYAYDYLLNWYGEKIYGYVPQPVKGKTFYLLIEPDPAKPVSYKGWLETVIKDGKVQKTVKLPSGFIIQKRTQATN